MYLKVAPPFTDVNSSELITSFSNPNYNIEEDILNCNVTTPLLEYTNEEILNRLEGVVSLRVAANTSADGEDAKLTTTSSTSGTGLWAYYKELAEAVRLREMESRNTTAPSVPPAAEEEEEKVEKVTEKEESESTDPCGGVRGEKK